MQAKAKSEQIVMSHLWLVGPFVVLVDYLSCDRL